MGKAKLVEAFHVTEGGYSHDSGQSILSTIIYLAIRVEGVFPVEQTEANFATTVVEFLKTADQIRMMAFLSVLNEAYLITGNESEYFEVIEYLWGAIDVSNRVLLLDSIENFSEGLISGGKKSQASARFYTQHDRFLRGKLKQLGEKDGQAFIAHQAEVCFDRTRELLRFIPRQTYDIVGNTVRQFLDPTGGKTSVTAEEIHDLAFPGNEEYTVLVVQAVLDSFVNAGFLRKKVTNKKVTVKTAEDDDEFEDEDTSSVNEIITVKYSLNKRGKEITDLGYSEVLSAVLAADALFQSSESRPMGGWEEIGDAQDEFHEASVVTKVEIDAPTRDGKRILYLADILFGSKDTDVNLLRRIIKEVSELPVEMRPDAIMVSGLLWGGYEFRKTDMRMANTMDVNEQFQAANFFLDELRQLGIPIIYDMSTEDFEMLHNNTVEVMRLMRSWGQPLADTQKAFIVYWKANLLTQDKAWDIHREFQRDVVFPYCLRSGRKLRTADEVFVYTEGRLRVEEYFILFEVYKLLCEGKEVPSEYAGILELSNIPLPDQTEFPLCTITNGVDIGWTGEHGDTFRTRAAHTWKFGEVSQYGNFTDVMLAYLAQLQAMGVPIPDELVESHQGHLFLGGPKAQKGQEHSPWAVVVPGFQRPLDLDQSTDVMRTKNASFRRMATRRMPATPGAVMTEHTVTGKFISTIMNGTVLEKMHDSKDRVVVATAIDWQTGSVTARPDLQANFLDIILHEVLPDYPVYLYFGGDIIQGRNYLDMANENVRTLLTRIKDQKKFIEALLRLSFMGVSPAELDNIIKVFMLAGNHEYNSFSGATGDDHMQWLESTMASIVGSQRVVLLDSLTTDRGDYMVGPAGFTNVAGYGLFMQHMELERGAKGSGSRPAIFSATEAMTGLGPLWRPTDFSIYGHWHHEMVTAGGDKIFIGAPSIAGLSGYELIRGYYPQIGAVLLKLGGGLPPQIEFLGFKTLAQHKITRGPLSDASLIRDGYKEPNHFDPMAHGFYTYDQRQPKSLLQQKLWTLISELVLSPKSMLTT